MWLVFSYLKITPRLVPLSHYDLRNNGCAVYDLRQSFLHDDHVYILTHVGLIVVDEHVGRILLLTVCEKFRLCQTRIEEKKPRIKRALVI